MAADTKLFVQPGGWLNLKWTPDDSADDPVAGLFPGGGTLLLGIEKSGAEPSDFLTLTWLDQECRLNSVHGLFYEGLTNGTASLAVQTKLPNGAKDSDPDYLLRLTLSEDKTGKLPQFKLTGTIGRSLPPHGRPSTGTVGIFTAEANPIGTEWPVFWRFLPWLRWLAPLFDKPRHARRPAP